MLLCVVLVAEQASGAFATGDWSRYEARSFTLISKAEEEQVADLIWQLEALSDLARMLTNAPNGTSPHPLTVVLMQGTSDFHSMAGAGNVLGYRLNTARGVYMVVRQQKYREDYMSSSVTLHEYTHHLMLSQVMVSYPFWYSEGLPEFLSTVRFEDGSAIIGSPPPVRAQSLTNDRMQLSVKELVRPVGQHIDGLYASGWLLVHYLLLSAESRAEGGADKLSKYLEAYSEGRNDLATFESIFGLNAKQFDRKLAEYRSQGLPAFSIPFATDQSMGVYTKTPMTKADVALQLGDIARHRAPRVARIIYRQALHEPLTKARALSGLALGFAQGGRFGPARRNMRKALEIEKQDPIIWAEFAELEHIQCVRKSTCSDPATLEAMLEYANNANRLAPELMESRLRLGVAELLNENYADAVVALTSALVLNPGLAKTNLHLGRAFLGLKYYDDAKRVLGVAMAAFGDDPDHPERAQIASLIKHIDAIQAEMLDPDS